VDRLIPTDELDRGGKDAGVTAFIDRQLTGPYGGHDWLYMQGPFSSNPLPTQGLQSPLVPREQYRLGLAALEAYCKENFNGRNFVQLNGDEKDKLLAGMEKGDVKFDNFSSRMLFNAVDSNTIEGFFADPIYGGNRDMAAWKLIGFPGVRYDFRDVMAKPNQAYTHRRWRCRAGRRGEKTDSPSSSAQGCRHRRPRLDRINQGARTRPHRPFMWSRSSAARGAIPRRFQHRDRARRPPLCHPP
jgi:hypothetical protein